MRISDWSSDVCSSDLRHSHISRRAGLPSPQKGCRPGIQCRDPSSYPREIADRGFPTFAAGDRKSVVEGKSVYVRVDIGVRRILKKKNTLQKYCSVNTQYLMPTSR